MGFEVGEPEVEEDTDGEAPPVGFDRRSAVGMMRRWGGESEEIFEWRSRPRRPRIEEGEEEGIEAVRENLLFEFKTAVYKMKDAILRRKEDDVDDDVMPMPAPVPGPFVAIVVTNMAVAAEEKEEDEAVAVEEGGSSSAAVVVVRPWNPSTKRAACKPPLGGGGKGLKIEEMKVNYSPVRSEGSNGCKSLRLVRGASRLGLEKKDRPKDRLKFSLTLSNKEIKEDFMQMLGHRPPRCSKKLPRVVQKQLDLRQF